MKNLVFQFYLTVTLWQCGIAERSGNSYFYDKVEGTLFDKLPGTTQLLNSVYQFSPPRGGHNQQPFNPATPILAELEIVPSNLVYANSRDVGGLQQQESGNFQSPPDFARTQQVYRGSGGGNYHPIACNIQDGRQAQSVAQGPCASEPIVAQYHPDLVDLSSGGTLTRLIRTCGPHNNCNSYRLQSNVNRHLGVLLMQRKSDGEFLNLQRRGSRLDNQAEGAPLVRPPNRRLIKYTEIERDEPFN